MFTGIVSVFIVGFIFNCYLRRNLASDIEERLYAIAETIESTGDWDRNSVEEFSKYASQAKPDSSAMQKINAIMNKHFVNNMAVDYLYWGGWAPSLHQKLNQQIRQKWANNVDDEDFVINLQAQTATFQEQRVFLGQCTCQDFQERKLPCKHIYKLAIELGFPVRILMNKAV